MSDTLKEKKKKRYMRYFFFAITKAPQARIRILLCIVTSNIIYVVEFLGLKQSYIPIPSTLNIYDLILWHTQLIVCAVKS